MLFLGTIAVKERKQSVHGRSMCYALVVSVTENWDSLLAISVKCGSFIGHGKSVLGIYLSITDLLQS